tara:strand:+ start:2134 stop:2619 length:486 start_codon:yes stop_codon:yes gene_type:complete
MLSLNQLAEAKKKTSISINPKKDKLMEKDKNNQEDTAYEGQEEVCEKSNQENESSILTFNDYLNEKTRYAKETGKNLKSGKPQPEGGSAKGDKAYQFVLAKIKREHGAGAVQQSSKEKKKVKGDKTRRQAGDNKFTPAEKVAKRRASKADADAAMRDTRGT